ncbi:hypothetical protein COL154_004380 [Colletotrichum chrysophilum]|nr:hypothetical protein COL154_004380 [Colletotrichum chrysophilum]
MAGRFILGFGSSFNGAGLLIAEIAHPQHRAKISAIVNCMYGVGSTFCAWLALGTIKISTEWSWRSLTILQAFPGLLVLSLIWWIPESPRWLIAKERYEEAEQMLAKYHGNGDRTNETVAFEFREMKQTLALEFQHGRSSSYLDFARYAGNRYRVVILISLAMVSQYSGTNLFSNYANKIYEGADFCYLLFVYFFYPETKNLTLEEVARVFDGDDAKAAQVDIEEVKKELEEEQKKGAQVDVKAL